MKDALKIILLNEDKTLEIDENNIFERVELIGTITRIEVSDELIPFRYLIGQVIIDKNPKLRSVICKCL